MSKVRIKLIDRVLRNDGMFTLEGLRDSDVATRESDVLGALNELE
jgi:hypothetical protein